MKDQPVLVETQGRVGLITLRLWLFFYSPKLCRSWWLCCKHGSS